MNSLKIIRRARLGTAMAAVALSLGAIGAATPAAAASHSARPAETLNLSQGTGTMVRLSEPMTDVFVANDSIADVQVRSASQLYIFGKTRGETTIYATSKAGRVVYAANVRVGKNISSIDEMLHLAMPDANVVATPMNNLVLLTGTVASPDDAETAERLVTNYLGNDTTYGVVNRLRTATPLQVTLKVKIVEVNRSLLKKIGVNLLTSDPTSGFKFGIAQGGGIFVPAPGNRPCRDWRHHPQRHRLHAGCQRKAVRAQYHFVARSRPDRRPDHHARRTEPDRAVGRDRKLPRRR